MPDKTAENEFIKEVHVLLSNGEEEALQIFLRRARPEDIEAGAEHTGRHPKSKLAQPDNRITFFEETTIDPNH
jgi:hypothetical protein